MATQGKVRERPCLVFLVAQSWIPNCVFQDSFTNPQNYPEPHNRITAQQFPLAVSPG